MTSPPNRYQRTPEPGNPARTEAGRCSKRRASSIRRRTAPVDAFRAALRRNWRLWTIFQANLLDPGCPVPAEIRRNLLGLANFIDRHTAELLAKRDPTKVEVLVNINRQISEGLLDGQRAARRRARRPPASVRLARPDHLTPPMTPLGAGRGRPIARRSRRGPRGRARISLHGDTEAALGVARAAHPSRRRAHRRRASSWRMMAWTHGPARLGARPRPRMPRERRRWTAPSPRRWRRFMRRPASWSKASISASSRRRSARRAPLAALVPAELPVVRARPIVAIQERPLLGRARSAISRAASSTTRSRTRASTSRSIRTIARAARFYAAAAASRRPRGRGGRAAAAGRRPRRNAARALASLYARCLAAVGEAAAARAWHASRAIARARGCRHRRGAHRRRALARDARAADGARRGMGARFLSAAPSRERARRRRQARHRLSRQRTRRPRRRRRHRRGRARA